jgi:2-furoyl-CoA dehydrogenase large subunit
MLRQPAPSPAAGEVPAMQGALRGRDRVDIPAPRQAVWQALVDPESLRQIIPGCESIELAGDTYRARVRIAVAGIGATYDAELRMFDRHEPERLRLSGKVASKLGFGTGEAYVSLSESAPGHTVLTYDYAADVGGRLAAFGHRMLDGIVRMLLGSFFSRLRAHLRDEERPGRLLARLHGPWAMLRALWARR